MARFDAELYLRLIGEEMLLGAQSSGHGWSTPLHDAAGALVAIGAISGSAARNVADDYELAQSLRSPDGRGGVWRTHHRRGRAGALRFTRVVPLNTVLEDARGSLALRYAMFGTEATSLGFVYRTRLDEGSKGRRRGMWMMHGPTQLPWGVPAPALNDDHGTSAPLSFSGSGSDLEWSGRLSTDVPLATDTCWLDYDGHRLELAASPTRTEVSVEALPGADPAHRYLWRCLAVADRHGPPSIDPELAALVAAGALAPQDPVIVELRAVLERLPQHYFHRPGKRGIRNLPEPWRSLLARVGKDDGPPGRIVLGARTPLFGGFRVGVVSLESDTSGFRAEVEMTPGEIIHPRLVAVDVDRLVWWARDNRGNNYLGSRGNWSAGGDHGGGEVEFWPALDPRATRLELCPTATAARAVIGFPLDWITSPSSAAEVPSP